MEGRSQPLPPEHARKLAQRLMDGQLALFVGAGLSHLAPRKDGGSRRLPLWGELRAAIATECLGEDDASLANPLDLFDAIVGEHDRATLERALRKHLDDGPYEPSAAHRALTRLPWRAVFTTNYDGLLARALDCRAIVEERDYDRAAQERDAVPLFQIHGTSDVPHTLTRDDYRLWEQKHPHAHHALKDMFLYRTVLFVGYGMGDPHLDTLLATVRQITEGHERRFYAWTWRGSERLHRLLDSRDKIEAVALRSEEEWEHAFQQLHRALEELKSESTRPSVVALPNDAFSYERAQYATAVRARFGVANLAAMYLPGAGYARGDVQLDEIYVEPAVLLKDPLSELTERSWTLQGERAREATSEEGEPTAPRVQGASRVVAEQDRLVLLGLPGEGKTTLLRQTLIAAAERWRDAPEREPLPVYWRLADWEHAGGERDGRLLAYVARTLPTLCEVGSNAVAAWSRRPILWLLDGVDEIRSPAQRQAFAEELAATARQRPGDRFLVTARPPGDPSAHLGAGWTRAEIQALDDGRIREVLSRWGRVLKQKEGYELPVRELERALGEHPGLRRVRGNPLLLTLAILFFKAHRKAPRDRLEFYEYGSRTLKDTWARSRLQTADAELPDERYFDTLLEEIALEAMERGAVGVSRERFEEKLRELLSARGVPGHVQDEEVRRTLRAAEDIVGVLVAQSPDRFGFLHLTFQEYFAARALAKRSGEVERYIERFWDDPDWDETWCLYVLAIQEDAARLTHLFETTLRQAEPIDAVLHGPEMRCLRWAGVGSYPWPAAVLGVFDAVNAQVREKRGDLLGVLEVLGRWERDDCGPLEPACLELLTRDRTLGLSAIRALARFQGRGAIRAALIARLDDEDRDVRDVVAGTLATLAIEPEVRAALIARLDDKEALVRDAVTGALGAQAGEPEVRAALIARLDDEHPRVRFTAAGALGKQANEPEVRAALNARLADGDWIVRWAVTMALGAHAGEPEVRAALIARLDDKEGLVRRTVAGALEAHAGEPEVRAALIARLDDEEAAVRGAVAVALGAHAGEFEVRAALVERLADEDSLVRLLVAGALGAHTGEYERRAALVARLADEDWSARLTTVEALGAQAGEPEVRAALLARFADGKWLVRRAVARALGAHAGKPEVRAALVARLDDEEATVRGAVARALGGQAGEPEVRAALLARLADGKWLVRRSVAGALGWHAGELEVRAALLERLNDEEAGVRGAVARALGGQAGEPEVRAALLARLADEDWDVRRAAAAALSSHRRGQK